MAVPPGLTIRAGLPAIVMPVSAKDRFTTEDAPIAILSAMTIGP